jgi:hypothetical protein
MSATLDGSRDGAQAETLLVPCPFPDRSNAHGADAAEYVRSVAAEIGLGGQAADRVLHSMALGEAAALTYPDADAERLGVAASWIAFLVLFDDAWSDMLTLDGDWRAKVTAQHRVVGEVLGGRPASRDDGPLILLLQRILTDISRLAAGWDDSRFRNEIKRYLAATLWELDARSRGQVPDLATYMRMRRVFSTMGIQLELDYFVCPLRLPAQLRDHPCIQLADAAVADYGCLANDLYSYREEMARGQISNVITVLQREHGWDVSQAKRYAVRLCAQALASFADLRSRLEFLGVPADEEVTRYFDHYEAFMSAAARWPARSARYGSANDS